MKSFNVSTPVAFLIMFAWNSGIWLLLAFFSYLYNRGFYDGVVCGIFLLQAWNKGVHTWRQLNA